MWFNMVIAISHTKNYEDLYLFDMMYAGHSSKKNMLKFDFLNSILRTSNMRMESILYSLRYELFLILNLCPKI